MGGDMQFYMKIELFKNGIYAGKGTTVYEAPGLLGALHQAVEMLERNPSTLRSDTQSPQCEERITVGALLTYSS